MTNTEKLEWLKVYLKNCLGEELPTTQGNYTYDYMRIADNTVLTKMPEVDSSGLRKTYTLDLDSIVEFCDSVEELTKETFAVVCTNSPYLKDWYLWNVERGRIEL